MKKRALGIILSVLCVLLLFSACGGKDKKEKKKSDEAKVKVEKEESEEKEDEEEEVKLSPEEGTPFTTEAVRDVTMGPVTVHCQWIPFESPYIVDDIFSGRVAAAGDRVWILADGKLKEYQYANDAVTFVKDISIGDGYSEITADETGNLYVSSKLRYAWIAGAAKQDDGSILVALTQDRDDDSATELLLYRLSGF